MASDSAPRASDMGPSALRYAGSKPACAGPVTRSTTRQHRIEERRPCRRRRLAFLARGQACELMYRAGREAIAQGRLPSSSAATTRSRTAPSRRHPRRPAGLWVNATATQHAGPRPGNIHGMAARSCGGASDWEPRRPGPVQPQSGVSAARPRGAEKARSSRGRRIYTMRESTTVRVADGRAKPSTPLAPAALHVSLDMDCRNRASPGVGQKGPGG